MTMRRLFPLLQHPCCIFRKRILKESVQQGSANTGNEVTRTYSDRHVDTDNQNSHNNNHIVGDNGAIIASSTIPYLGKGVAIGQVATQQRTYTNEDIKQFAAVVQDFNPLHSAMDWNEKESTPLLSWTVHERHGLIQFQNNTAENPNGGDNNNNKGNNLITKPIVHGMLVSSIFSSIFATISPGCVYMNQSLDFINPVYVDEMIEGRVEIQKIRKWKKEGIVVQCLTQVLKVEQNVENSELTGNPRRGGGVAVNGIANVWLCSGYVLL